MIGKNNPLNIRYSKANNWKGQTGHTRGFCNFSSLEFGVRAAIYLLFVSYRRKGAKTIAELITLFAPSSENDTDAYIKYVSDKCFTLPFVVPKYKSDVIDIIFYMARYEGNPISVDVIEKVYESYFKDLFKDK